MSKKNGKYGILLHIVSMLIQMIFNQETRISYVSDFPKWLAEGSFKSKL